MSGWSPEPDKAGELGLTWFTATSADGWNT